jgi:hypothetical protein
VINPLPKCVHIAIPQTLDTETELVRANRPFGAIGDVGPGEVGRFSGWALKNYGFNPVSFLDVVRNLRWWGESGRHRQIVILSTSRSKILKARRSDIRKVSEGGGTKWVREW